MSLPIRARRTGTRAVLTVAALTSGLVIATHAWAGGEPYLGWDFGNGYGIGLGAPPSAYDPCPSYGWPVYPYRCRYHYRHHARHHSHRAY